MKGIRGISQLSRHLYVAQVARELVGARAKPTHFPRQEVQVTRLPSGLVVASLENHSPASKIGVFVNAGSRYETPDNQGVTHQLRLASNLTTKGASGFRICRGVEAVGACLSVTSTRENMVYTVDCLRDHIDTVMEYLINVTTAPEFRPWEVFELTARVKRDKTLSYQNTQISVLESLHEAAYKNTLSNSLYCPDYMIGNITPEQMHAFVQSNYTSSRMALVGLGVEHEVLKQVGEQFLNIRSGTGSARTLAQYRGGELRVPARSTLVHSAVVCEGVSVGADQAWAFSVLQHLVGAGPRIKRGSNTTSKLGQSVSKATTKPASAAAFNASYLDSGLFGIYVISQAADAERVIKAAVAEVKGVSEGNLAEEDLTRAKAQLNSEYLMSLETSEGLFEVLGSQALTEAGYLSPETVAQKIQAVTANDVVDAAKKFASGKKTMASYGNLINMPFVDEI